MTFVYCHMQWGLFPLVPGGEERGGEWGRGGGADGERWGERGGEGEGQRGKGTMIRLESSTCKYSNAG